MTVVVCLLSTDKIYEQILRISKRARRTLSHTENCEFRCKKKSDLCVVRKEICATITLLLLRVKRVSQFFLLLLPPIPSGESSGQPWDPHGEGGGGEGRREEKGRNGRCRSAGTNTKLSGGKKNKHTYIDITYANWKEVEACPFLPPPLFPAKKMKYLHSRRIKEGQRSCDGAKERKVMQRGKGVGVSEAGREGNPRSLYANLTAKFTISQRR